MFASPSSSSSSEAGAIVNPIEAAACAIAQRTSKIRPSTDFESTVYDFDNPTIPAPTESTSGKEQQQQRQEDKNKSKYIGKLLVSAKRRADEVEQRRVEQAKENKVQRFETKSYRAALRRRDEQQKEQQKDLDKLAAEVEVEKSTDNHVNALRFVVADMAWRRGSNADVDEENPDENKGTGNNENNDLAEYEGTRTEGDGDVLRKRVQSRFDVAPQKDRPSNEELKTENRHEKKIPESQIVEMEKQENGKKKVEQALKPEKVRKKRGERRNNEESIEAYRRRYLERRTQRLSAQLNGKDDFI